MTPSLAEPHYPPSLAETDTLCSVGQLLEDRPLDAIRAFFEARGIQLVVHRKPRPRYSKQELRRLPRSVRRAIEQDTSTHWVDLGTFWPYFGSGTSDEEAIRRAARRYRIEQADPEASGE